MPVIIKNKTGENVLRRLDDLPPVDANPFRVGIVVIGRNEGRRLIDCLNSLGLGRERTVYVDSGSTDESPEIAATIVAAVLRLDMDIPFTAARARNEGFNELMSRWPYTPFIQFIDGDCLLDDQWLQIATTFLIEREDVGLVFGRRRERYPDKTPYNALCDREWNGPAGGVEECGGDILIRAAVLQDVGGYCNDLIAGEEPELCVRLRAKGWWVWRLTAEMTRHDANMTRFSQWWRRSMRSGHAYAQVSHLHRMSPFGIWRRSVRRAVSWGGLVPLIAMGGAALHPATLGILALYPLQIIRLAWRQEKSVEGRWRNAAFDVIGKFPEMQGILQFYFNRLVRRRQAIIEYK